MADKSKKSDVQDNDALPVEMVNGEATLANSASAAPVVPLAGVPETPLSNVGVMGSGPAVPSTDHYASDLSPNQDTSGPTKVAPDATRAAAGEL